MIKGIIFDYGGTIDSRSEHWSEVIFRAWKAAGVEVDKAVFRDCYVHAERELARNYHIFPQDDFRTLIRKKAVIELEKLCELEPNAIDAKRLNKISDLIADYCNASARECVEEARPVLEALSKKYPMMLVSNFYGNVDSVLRAYGIREYFNGVIESAVVGVRKPDPRIFMLGVVALGFNPEEVLVVGDSLKKDILPAESIGCKVAWIKGKGWTDDEDAAEHPSQIASIGSLLSILC